MRINHLHLHVASVERAADFYTRHFGFRPHVRHGEVLFMRDAADFDLALAPGAPAELPAWPGPDRRSRLVLILRGAARAAAVEASWHAAIAQGVPA